MPIGMSALFVSLLTLAAVLGVRMRKGLQQATDMSIALAPASSNNMLELKAQESTSHDTLLCGTICCSGLYGCPVAPRHPRTHGLLRPRGPLRECVPFGAQALPRGRAHTRPCGHARIPRLPRGRVWCHAALRGQDRWHCHQPVLEGARGILARHTPLHRGARDLPCTPRLDGADRAGELFPAPSRVHSWGPRLRPY